MPRCSVITPIARDARREDYAVFARLFPELRVPDATPTAEQYEAKIRPHAFFLWDGTRPVAYAFWQPLADVALVIHVVVDPRWRARGVGTALMHELAARAKAAGCSSWELNVKPDNVPATRLYERCGMRAAARLSAMRMAWEDVGRLPAEPGLDAFVVGPEDDAHVETRMGLPRGQISVLRAEGRVLPALRRGDALVAFAAFDPLFPGAKPFLAATPGTARALLESMRAHARPEHPFVRFVLEDGAAQSAVRAAGGESVLEILRMAGPIAL
jgi:GNAT superfamily N-acetyltransferase